jgi:hypothetical protein
MRRKITSDILLTHIHDSTLIIILHFPSQKINQLAQSYKVRALRLEKNLLFHILCYVLGKQLHIFILQIE